MKIIQACREKIPQSPLGMGNLQIIFLLVGAALVIGMQMVKERRGKHAD